MKLDISNKQLRRYEYIETKLLWDEGITANELAITFSISRQAAQAVLNEYRKLYPLQMTYSPNLKKHLATDGFTPQFVRKSAKLFLDYLRGQTLGQYYKEEEDWSDIEITDVNQKLQTELDTRNTQIILTALRRHKSVAIEYLKKRNVSEKTMFRVISPNHLIFASNRYHIRAYCHIKLAYLDFVLSNILSVEFSPEEWVSSADDMEWNEIVTLRLKPNPELPKDTQNAILKRYNTPDGVREIICRKALIYYIEKSLLINQEDRIPLWMIE
ncbi:MAG: WYL domain-containing protein [Desulfamplus sp.]